MIHSQTDYEEIIKYIGGELPYEDSAEFEKILNKENNLKDKLNNILEIEHFLKDSQLNEFRKTVQLVNKQFHKFSNKNRKKKQFFQMPDISRLYKAASILILVSISLAVIYKISTPKYSTGEKLFSEYYQSYEENVSTRAIASHLIDFQLAIDAYKNKEYKKSIDYFNKVIILSSTVNFYKGIASIECDDYNSAIISLQLVVNDSASLYNNQARWFLALTWLKLNKPKNSIPHLKYLIDNDRFYKQKASEILNKLQ